jgi:hypothetical protein
VGSLVIKIDGNLVINFIFDVKVIFSLLTTSKLCPHFSLPPLVAWAATEDRNRVLLHRFLKPPSVHSALLDHPTSSPVPRQGHYAPAAQHRLHGGSAQTSMCGSRRCHPRCTATHGPGFSVAWGPRPPRGGMGAVHKIGDGERVLAAIWLGDGEWERKMKCFFSVINLICNYNSFI